MKGYTKLEKFVDDCNTYNIKITGCAMQFTAKGKKITDW